jgi:hypothetical protein
MSERHEYAPQMSAMKERRLTAPTAWWHWVVFLLLQAGVMLMAISHESLWIDEFWTAHFAHLDSWAQFIDLMLVPSGSQTPLHFVHFYLWEQWAPAGEFFFRLANLPLFVLGQGALFWALRNYPRRFSLLFLALSALHPMVWQYANEARPYVMMHAGAQMMLAHLLNLHARAAGDTRVEPLSLLCFVVGGTLLFGASLLGAFWVFAACVYLLWHHHRHANWRALTRGVNALLWTLFVAAIGLLLVYYLNSLLRGAGASRISTSTPATVLFALYELLGLSGLGPGRLELRAAGLAALRPYAFVLLATAGVVLFALATGLKQAQERLGRQPGTPGLMLMVGLGLFPVIVVVLSGFGMQWRVLGRHLIAALPLVNLLCALGLARMFETPLRRGRAVPWCLAAACLVLLTVSSLSLRFADRHRKDDYRAAATVAQQAVALGQRVWWAADSVGAQYYGLPGNFDFMGELTGFHKPLVCTDQAAVLSIANATLDCLQGLTPPDVLILSKPETFDIRGDIDRYLKWRGFVKVQDLPAFTVWRAR